MSKVSNLTAQQEEEMQELRDQVKNLETKNKKYLEVICQTASDQEEVKVQLDTARDAVNLSKKSKQIDIEPLIDTNEIEAML